MNPLFWLFCVVALAAGWGAIALANSSPKLSGITVAIVFGFVGIFVLWWLVVLFLFIDAKIMPWYQANCVQGTRSACEVVTWYLAYSHVVYYPLAVALTHLIGKLLLSVRNRIGLAVKVADT